jgi:acyl-[acyl-carrier-protein]-phospholipid O-acyltransferase/long-chain-fatty-acid--[acyl-carrier-protein] ligase
MSFFRTERFLPLFKTQFLGAFNDNMLKNALVMLLTYRIATQAGYNVPMLVTIAGSMLIVPSLFFSATAGELADKFDKGNLTRIIKMVEIGIMAVATAGFLFTSVPILFFALFCMGVHSTFFGPIKLALLPQHLKEDELLPGNSYIEAGTFLAILLGTLVGGLLILLPYGGFVISAALIAVAITGYMTAQKIPPAPAPDPTLSVNWNIARETWRIVDYARHDRNIFLCIMGISWFWLVGATFLAQVAPFVKDFLHAEARVVTLLLTMFSIGIGTGSLLANKLLRGRIQMTYVPVAALAITVFGTDLFFASHHAAGHGAALISVWQFLRSFTGLRVMFDFLMMAIAGGIYIVPLYAQVQHEGAPAHLARLIAASNVLSSLFMVASTVGTVALLALHFSIPQIFLVTSIANFFVAIYICRLLPDQLIRSVLRSALTFLYRVEVKGMENYAAAGNRVLIISNHTSLLDAVLIAAFMPERLHFAVNTFFAKKWWMQIVLKVVDAHPIDPGNPLAAKSLIDLLKRDTKCMVFPEGRLTVTGALMKIYEGPGMIADKSGAKLLPIRIDGAQYTPFSRLRGKVRIRWFPKITLTVLPAHEFDIPAEIKGRKRRQRASAQLYDVMSEMMFDSTDYRQTLFSALLTAREIHGGAQIIAEDVERKPLSFRAFLLRCFTLGWVLAKRYRNDSVMGILLPNSSVTTVTFFALQRCGKTPAMINFSAGGKQMVLACQLAGVKTVLTSKRFVKVGKLDAAIVDLKDAGIQIAYLEDIGAGVGTQDKLAGLLASLAPRFSYGGIRKRTNPDQPAVILFTSGSEGTPKGVALSHANILANCSQLASRVDFGPQDKVLNVLPMFHSFGLTGGTLLPILNGIKTFYYPSPLHYRIVPELIYDTNSTIMFGTDTFLSAYARFANPYDMNSIRYIFAGAEKLKDETRRVYADKYGVRVLEGYGATETSPVISINTPMHNRTGTVGRLLPGLKFRVDEVPGITEGGQLFVQGPNVMLGYLKADRPGEIQAPEDGWYDTGDIVAVDDEGYVSIKGRTKRFAKIGGEMVSLTAVEAAVARLWPEQKHAVVNIADAKKGEQIVLLTEFRDANRDELVRFCRAEKMSELAVPRRIMVVAALPVLGTGKADYQKAKLMAAEDAEANALRTVA